MKLGTTLKAMGLAAMMASTSFAAFADGHAMNIRATANSNENDEDYDGLVAFKNYFEAASNGAITVELFIGTQLCGHVAECPHCVAAGTLVVSVSTSPGASVLLLSL